MPDWSSTYERYRPEVLAFLKRKLWRRVELAEDLCQETFTRAMSASTEIRDPSRIRSYLYRTANNLVINQLRRGNRVIAENQLAEGVEIDKNIDHGAVSPYQTVERSELYAKIQELLTEVPDDQRIAFVGGVIERRPYTEIAQENDWTVSKVKICVFRARKHLMNELQEYR